MFKSLRLLVFIFVTVALVAGCQKKEEKKAAETAAPHGQGAKKESVVVVPDSVKGKWKAVKIAVTDKATNKESVFTIALGAQFAVPDTNIAIKVENFLPHFMMDGTTLTSQTNEPKNPAAQVRIYESNKEIYKGWLFSLYPTTHAFNHPKFGFTLVDFVPAS